MEKYFYNYTVPKQEDLANFQKYKRKLRSHLQLCQTLHGLNSTAEVKYRAFKQVIKNKSVRMIIIAVKRSSKKHLSAQWVLSTRTDEPTCVLSVHLKRVF